MTPEEMELCLEHGAQCVDTSHQEGVDNIDEILEVADGVMIALSLIHISGKPTK